MKSKKELVKMLNILRIKTDPGFRPGDNDPGIFYDDKITEHQKLRYLHEISILKWVLTDFEYDDKDMESNKDLEALI